MVELSAELECCIPTPDDTACRLEAQELAGIISAFLKEQPQMQRDVFLRRYWYGETVREIAQACGVKEVKVKTSLFRTRARLRAELEREGIKL